MYYKDNKNNVYSGNKALHEKNLGVVLTEITKKEFDQLVKEINTPTAAQILEQQLAEKHSYLASTDWIGAKYHDVVTIRSSMSKTDFIAKYQEIYDARDEARDFINANQTNA